MSFSKLAKIVAVIFLALVEISLPGPATGTENRPLVADTAAPAAPGPPAVPVFKLPQALSFCGEKLPLDQRYGREMLDREFTIMVYDRTQVVLWLKRAPRYLPFFARELKKAGLPEDLKYLPIIESSLIENIHSRAGAAGLWQFIKPTAKRMGLRVTSVLDERLDLLASTRAALRYLSDLHEEFGSWALALAAYNCGEKRVAKELARQKARDYFQLALPRESERYLYRLAAIKLIITRPGAYGFRIPDDQLYRPLSNRRVVLNPDHEYSLTDFALALGTTYHALKKLNPQLISRRLPRGRFNLVLPEECRRDPFLVLKKLTPLPELSGPRFYTVRRGDTLGAISRRFHVPTARLRALNRIKKDRIRIGQRLRLRE
jgi:hypothetical protein